MRLAIALFAMSSAFAQTQIPREYPPEAARFLVSKTTTLAAATEKVTVQNQQYTKVAFEQVTVRCSAACTVTFYQNGTAATATAITQGTSGFVAFNNNQRATSTAYHSSDVGSGKTLKTFNLESAGTFMFDCSKLFLNSSLAGNLSVGISSMTGDVTIQIQFVEDQS